MSFFEKLGLAHKEPVAEANERALLLAARKGDRRSFDHLVRPHERALRGFLAVRVTQDAVDDVLQETMIAAWHTLAKFSGKSRFKAWLFGIALHKATDHHRAKGKRSEEPYTEEIEGRYAPQRDWIAEFEMRHSIRELIGELSVPQREVLEMYYYAEMTLPELADVLGRNQNTVKYQFYRAHELVADGIRRIHGVAPSRPEERG